MKTIHTLAGIIASLLPLYAISVGQAEDLQNGMNALLGPLRNIERFIVDEEAFSDPANAREIAVDLQQLRSHFHTIETIPSRFHKLDGFVLALQQVSDILDDSTRRFNEGKVPYAWWRLRTLPSSCFACHATYKVSSTISASDAVDPSLDPMQQARFFLATRQFAAAKEKLSTVLQNPEFRFFFDEALRSLLLIETRIEKDPAGAISLFQGILTTSKLPEEDVHEVRMWLESLKKWKSSPAVSKNVLAEGEKLILAGSIKGIDLIRDDVSLLRGTALLHSALESGTLKPAERSKTLYLLGFAYEQLPLFFAESWTEMYLEQCIQEFPGSNDAKNAFRVYRQHIIADFTGSGGTDIPDEVSLHIDELRKKAYGEPAFDGKV